MSLYNKYRPTEFEDIIGNIPTITSIKSFLAHQDRAHSILLSGPSGCLRGDTPIYDPVDNTVLSVKERYQLKKEFHVVSISSDGNMVAALALPPVQYSEDQLYRVETSESTFFVTNEHQFLLDSGEYLSLKELIGKQFSSFPLRSISESCLLTHIQDAHHYLQTATDFQDGCHQEWHSCDELPLSFPKDAQEPLTLLNGVHEHTHEGLPLDCPDDVVKHIPFYPTCVPLSKNDYFFLNAFFDLLLKYVFSEEKHKWSCLLLKILQLIVVGKTLVCTNEKLISHPLVKSILNHTDIYQSFFCKFLSAYLSSKNRVVTSKATINKIVPESKEEYYDFHVPVHNNYWCNGLFHHNCGKTTLARIIARKLGCNPNDLVELNSANFRGVDTSRDILQQMRLKPLSGPIKVWILDECHKMTGEGQNALLKALEDTPSHVYFILATTDPQKLLKTIVNRCVEFKVQPLPENRLLFLLNKVCEKEGKKVSKEVLDQIAKNCQGSARKALTLLESVIDQDPEQQFTTLQQTVKEESEVIELCRALLQGKKWLEVSRILKGLQEGLEAEQIRMAVLGYCNKVLLDKESVQAFMIMDVFKDSFYYTGHAGLTRACYQVVFSC